ncbi:MAG: hypothetical protein ACRD4X_15375 [Candidatus Acidiferrales bacterium]
MKSSHTGTERRRSERTSQSLPVIIRGIDLLGQPFEERSSTLNLNLHGCRYASKYHLPKNTWVTLEILHGDERDNVRARVAWIQRPHSIRELFQIAVELESPRNIWALQEQPADWISGRDSAHAAEQQTNTAAFTPACAEGKTQDMTQRISGVGFASESAPGREQDAAADSPLLREWRAEMEREAAATVEKAAANAIEQMRAKLEEFERERAGAGVALASELAAKQESVLETLRSELDRDARGIRDMLHDLDRKAEGLRAENQAALDSISRLAQARLQAEAMQLRVAAETPTTPSANLENAAAELHARLQSELAIAQSQWTELLQSSIDGSVDRLVKELSGRSHEILRETEQKLSERLADLKQPLAHISSTAQETLAGVKTALDQEVARSRSSLADIEHSATRVKEYSAQLESASHHALNELHGRLENILESQTQEMNRRVESLIAAAPQRVGASLDSLGQQLAERTINEIDSKIELRLERVSASLHELSAREAQTEEGLRMHRERLRQIAESNQREASAQMTATLANLRGEFEGARKEALSKWSEELDAAGVRAAHAAAESIGRSSEWFQQEARARLQVLVEQAAATAATGFGEKSAEAAKKFDAQLDDHSKARVAELEQRFDGLAGDITGRTRGQLDAAAEAAAASFGQVIREVSERETQQFADASHGALADRARELESLTGDHLQKFYSESSASMEQLHARMASELDGSLARGRDALAAEFAKAADNFRAERESREAEWSKAAGQIGDEAAGKFQERLQAASDSWAVSCVRRLNERGQGAVDALLRSADQALRDSFARVFEDLSETLREHPLSSAGGQANPAGFAAPEGGEAPMPPPAEGASTSANA